MLAAGDRGAMNAVLLGSAVAPPLVVLAGAWWFLRAGRRHDEKERARGEGSRSGDSR